MSSRLSLLGLKTVFILTLVSTALAIGLGFGYPKRTAASKTAPKDYPVSVAEGKAQQILKAHIEISGEIPQFKNETVELIGYILNSKVDMQTQYTWSLPDDVELLSGERSGFIPKGLKNDWFESRIRVRGFSKQEKQQLFLSARIPGLRVPLIFNAQISSRPEDSLEFVAPRMMASEENLKNQKIKAKYRLVK